MVQVSSAIAPQVSSCGSPESVAVAPAPPPPPRHASSMANGAQQSEAHGMAEDPSVVHALLRSPHSRMVGGTEYSWCRAVSGGTGITILALLFSRSPAESALQRAIDKVQLDHPRLRSRLVWIHGRPAFSVSAEPYVKLEILDVPDASLSVDGFQDRMAMEGSGDGHSKGVEDNTANQSLEREGIEGNMANLSFDEKDAEHCCNGKEGDGSHDRSKGGHASVQHREERSDWLRIVEEELNTNDWSEQHHSLDPIPMVVVRLHRSPGGRSLLIVRLHTAVCDRTSAATILTEMLLFFYEIKHGFPPLKKGTQLSNGNGNGDGDPAAQEDSKQQENSCTADEQAVSFMPVEDAIPKGKANKPFWAHGVDLLGYSLGSRRNCVLPFQETNHPRRSQIALHSLSVENTQNLLQECSKQRTNRFGALCAAGLKATAICKQLGNRSEHYAIISLIDCRNHLDHVLSDSTVGFYHSAILNTHSLNEYADFWEVARRCSNSLEASLRNRKHFTDMGDVNFLMCQAIQYPQLTPASSLRTSHMVFFEEPVFDDMEDLKKAVDVEDYVGCSSVHGVGPSMAIFDTIQHGALKSVCVYPAPLHSRSQIENLLNTKTDIIINALKQ